MERGFHGPYTSKMWKMKIEKLKIYSPVSLLGRWGKIAEKLLYKAMLRFLSDSKLMSSNQSGSHMLNSFYQSFEKLANL